MLRWRDGNGGTKPWSGVRGADPDKTVVGGVGPLTGSPLRRVARVGGPGACQRRAARDDDDADIRRQQLPDAPDYGGVCADAGPAESPGLVIVGGEADLDLSRTAQLFPQPEGFFGGGLLPLREGVELRENRHRLLQITANRSIVLPTSRIAPGPDIPRRAFCISRLGASAVLLALGGGVGTVLGWLAGHVNFN